VIPVPQGHRHPAAGAPRAARAGRRCHRLLPQGGGGESAPPSRPLR